MARFCTPQLGACLNLGDEIRIISMAFICFSWWVMGGHRDRLKGPLGPLLRVETY